jgi:predicted nucleic acid-binding protein
MRKRVLDTNVLIEHWRHCGGHTGGDKTAADAIQWAKELIDRFDAGAVVTPVCVEFLAGVTSSRELELARAYLSQFRVIDQARIPAQDWEEARRLAERVPRDGKPRQLAGLPHPRHR